MRLVFSALFWLGLVLASGAQAEGGSAAERPDRTGWIGVWVLDREASDPIRPLLERMGAPGAARRMADRLTPTLTVTAIPDDGLRMVTESRVRTTRQDLVPDGAARESEDGRGRKVVSRAAWDEDGRLVVRQQNHLEADRIVEVQSSWARIEDRLELTIRVDDADAPLEIRRVFRRKS